MKDSQDWLVDITSLYAGYYAGKVTLGELYDGVDGIVRKHILQEANSLIEEMAIQFDDINPDDPRPDVIRNNTLAELRNKFNDTYKED